MGRSRRLRDGWLAWVLRSPVSGLIESSSALLTFRSQRSGREHTVPVRYARDGDTIWVLPGKSERKRLWIDLEGGALVRLRLGGSEIAGSARALSGRSEPGLVEEGLRVFLMRFPATARGLGVRKKGGGLDDALLAEVAKTAVMVRVATAPSEVP